MVNDTEVKNGQGQVGAKKPSESIDTQEGILDLLRDLTPKNELSNEDVDAFSINLPKDKVSRKALVLFLKGQDSLSEYLSLTKDLEQARKEVNEKLLRLAAEFENFKKRASQEKIQASNYAKELALKDILDFIGTFERGLLLSQDKDKNSDFYRGMQAILKDSDTLLSKNDIKKIQSKEGDNFDPSIHEAIEVRESSGIPKDKIINVIQNGYTINDKLLKPSLVVVSSGGGSSEK
jgi:molecular chaperone GrpE